MERATKRLTKELAKFDDEKFDDIFLDVDSDDIRKIKALIIGPVDSVFAGGFFYFSIFCEDYPISPPKVQFLTPTGPKFRCHPNLYASGKVCVTILNTYGNKEWSPMLSIKTILLTIQSLLDNDPLAKEPGCEKSNKEKKQHYALVSRLLIMQSVPVMLARKDIPPAFNVIMREYVANHRDIYEKSFEILDSCENMNISTMHGNYKVEGYRGFF